MNTTRKRLERREDCNAEQLRCWRALSWLLRGDHHMGKVYECGRGLRMSTHQDLATHDGNALTRAVIIAHIDCVRISVCSSGPRQVAIEVYPRDPNETACTMSRHPNTNELRTLLAAMEEFAREEQKVKT